MYEYLTESQFKRTKQQNTFLGQPEKFELDCILDDIV